ncbi:MAG: YfcC family protein [Gemmatimonadaceae bacterium]|nr:YfcC family protein [Gemmatimonadaceae bacterium]
MMAHVRLPHPIVLLLWGIALAAALTWLLPAGEYERRDDPQTGRRLVVAGTYRQVEPAPVGPVAALVAVPRGLVEGAEVIISILFVGGAFALVEQLGTLARGARAIVRRFEGRGIWAIPAVAFVFASFGAMENMQEEIIALVPVLLVLGRGLGVDAITMVAASLGAAAVGSAFGPSNPFQAGIALKLAQLPLLSGAGLRLAMLAAGWTTWVAYTMRHATRHRVAVAEGVDGAHAGDSFSRRDGVILLLTLLPLATYVYGVLRFDWGFNELSALFFLAALVIGVVGGMGLSEATASYLRGMESMVGASVLVGVARGISVVLSDGRVIDTVVHGLAAPLEGQPPAVAALLMIPIHGLIHIAVPSVSAQAALTMPILVPLSDLIALSRQATVLAYETGAGLTELLIPTNAALMAVLLAAGVPYTRWIAFAFRGFLLLTAIGVAGTLVAVASGA